MAGWFIIASYLALVALLGLPGLVLAGVHILVLVLAVPRK